MAELDDTALGAEARPKATTAETFRAIADELRAIERRTGRVRRGMRSGADNRALGIVTTSFAVGFAGSWFVRAAAARRSTGSRSTPPDVATSPDEVRDGA